MPELGSALFWRARLLCRAASGVSEDRERPRCAWGILLPSWLGLGLGLGFG